MSDLGNDRARILVGDAQDRLRDLPENSVHTVVTSPPYWGLRDYHVDGQIGLEDDLRAHVDTLVRVFREVRRVLRPDGTLWLNYGDSYAGDGGTGTDLGDPDEDSEAYKKWERDAADLKPKDLIGIPWRVAFALQRDGWYLRSDIVWHKPNPMPESVLDRPTRAHEFVFLLSPSRHYYYDADAIRQPYADTSHERYSHGLEHTATDIQAHQPHRGRNQDGRRDGPNPLGANKRDVWTEANNGYDGAHFATFPPDLVRHCIQAGTSAKGACPLCGAPLERETEKSGQGKVRNVRRGPKLPDRNGGKGSVARIEWRENVVRHTTGWMRNCDCDMNETEPCVVLDPFLGAGTTALVALEEGRHAVGVELNPEYAEMAWERVQDLAEMRRLDAF